MFPTLEERILAPNKFKAHKACNMPIDWVLTIINTPILWKYVACHLGYKASTATIFTL